MIWILLILQAALLAWLFERALSLAPFSKAWRYRLAFMGGGLLAFLLTWFYESLTASALPGGQQPRLAWEVFLWFSSAALGSFLGCLTATHLRERLWEDNAPPPVDIQEAVWAVHQKINGARRSEPAGKRLFDLLLSLLGLAFSAPVWLASLFLVWFEDPGPLLFVKNSVGRGGVNFHQFKIRSMVHAAEQVSGPVLAQEADERVLWIGRLLRKTALDELPQLLNILRGDMSFVGPRPQRTVLVYGYLQALPAYAERHSVRPGLAGLAQVAGDYYLTPLQKLRFDRLYIRYMSLGYDLKLLALAFLLAFYYRWKKNWDGRLPRRLLH